MHDKELSLVPYCHWHNLKGFAGRAYHSCSHWGIENDIAESRHKNLSRLRTREKRGLCNGQQELAPVSTSWIRKYTDV